jgi:ribosomal protein S18 acetylase RimI-like enzyme
MYTIRLATERDAGAIATQRVRMFRDNDLKAVSAWASLKRHSEQWIAEKLRTGVYIGWIAEDCGSAHKRHERPIVGGAGLWIMEWPPHYLHLEPIRGYLLNFYVAPRARRQGIAKRLVDLAVTECRKRQIRMAVLHASPMGRPVYESLGWLPSNEMTFRV